MQRINPPLLPAMLLAAALALSPMAGAQESMPFVGTWKMNVQKSTIDPAAGPPPLRHTYTYVIEGSLLTVIVEGMDAAGTLINPEKKKATIIFDGKDHVETRVPWDSAAWTRVNANTYTVVRKKGGSVIGTGAVSVSQDGKTMTVITKTPNRRGQLVTIVGVYDRQ